MLSASKDSVINITVQGSDEIKAMNSIEKLFQNKFDEDL